MNNPRLAILQGKALLLELDVSIMSACVFFDAFWLMQWCFVL